MLGAAEHRSERIRRCVSEKRRPQQTFGVPKPKAWGCWAPKIRSASLVASLYQGSFPSLTDLGERQPELTFELDQVAAREAEQRDLDVVAAGK